MRIDFYTHIHKQQRKQMFALSTQLSEFSFTESPQVEIFSKEWSGWLNDMQHHMVSEETFVHPLLVKKMPNIEKNLHQEHEELERELKNLDESFNYFRLMSLTYPKLQEQALEFYRGLNRFISVYLMHINEEEYVMQNLWEIAVDGELRGMMIAFQTSDGIEKGKKWLLNNLPAMSANEKLLMFNTVKLLAPENIFISMCQLTRDIMGEKEWQVINSQL